MGGARTRRQSGAQREVVAARTGHFTRLDKIEQAMAPEPKQKKTWFGAIPFRSVLTALVLAGALGIHVVAPFLAWSWCQQPFTGALMEHTLIVSAFAEGQWEGDGPGLAIQDRIVAVNGESVQNRQQFESALKTTSFSSEAPTLTVESSDGQRGRAVREVTANLSAFPRLDLVVRFAIPYIVALCYLSIGLLVFGQRRASDQARAFAVFCASTSTVMSLTFDTTTTHLLTRIWGTAVLLAGVSLVWLASSLVPKGWFLRTRWVPGAFLAAASLLFVWNQITLYTPGRPRGYLGAWLASHIFLTSSAALFVLVLFGLLLRSRRGQMRLQTHLVLIGLVAAFMPIMLWSSIAMLGRLFPSLEQIWFLFTLTSFPPMILFPIATSYVVYHPQLADVESESSQRARADVPAMLQRISRDLASSLDLEAILQKLLSHAGELFGPRHACVFIRAPSGHYEFARAWGECDPATLYGACFNRQDFVVVRMTRDGKCVIVQPDADWRAQLREDESQRLDDLDAALLAPLRTQEQLLGFLVLGVQSSGARYTEKDAALLSMLVDQAAIVGENARLYAQQVEQGRYLVRQTRQLTDILALGDRLKSLDPDVVVQSTVEAVYESLGFDLVTLSLVDDQYPGRVRVVAWAGAGNATWERLAMTTFPLLDFDALDSVQKLGHCYLTCAPGSERQISSLRKAIAWQEGDQLYVPLTSNEGLLGYLTVDRPKDGMRPTDSTLEVLEIFANQAAVAIQNAQLYTNIDRALDERLDELSTLQEIDRQINIKLDFKHVINTTLDWAMRITSAVAGTVAMLSEDGESLLCVAHRGYPESVDRFWDTPWPVTEGIIGRVVRTGEPALVEDTVQDADYVDVLTSVRSHLSAPIKRQDRVIGALSLESIEPNGFSADHVALLMRLADHATIAIENAGLYDQTQRRVAELEALHQISLDLSSQLYVHAVLDSIVTNAQMLVLADHATLYLYDAHQDALSFGTSLSRAGKQQHPPIPIADNRLTLAVARRGESIVIHDTAGHDMVPVDLWPIGAIASIPLQAESVLGVFDVAFDKPHFFTVDDLRVLNVLANQAAIAIKNAQLYADIQRANDAKSQFVSIVSHELKVPMTSIQGYGRMLLMGAGGEVTETQREFVDVILANVNRMSDLVTDLLDSVRIESGRIQLTPRPVSLSKIVNDSVNAVRAQIEARKHELIVEIPDDLPDVLADPGRTMQVMANLLDNAYKYTLDGGQIKIWAQCRDEYESTGGQWVLCAISDTGIGLLPQDQARIFQQFFRVRDPRMNNEFGAGLGLSIARSIVELHGGRIWVKSTHGQGSTFYFTLPAARA
ncbi:MAG: GAF domain-containing protein [Anaerolineae bacterium]|nr:GAF domain-containing protein [Anaerolineae bacterium]